MNIVSGYWKSIDGSVTYGYCTCGREVKSTKEGRDEKCPMCGAKLVWDLDNYELWIGYKKQ
jgi:DNA-directed RNA polymerase subunit RPC12/RpoP